MKKILLGIGLSFFTFLSSFGQGPFYQYFDGADTLDWSSVDVQIIPSMGNIWQIGKPQKIIFDSAATAPNVLVTDTINNYPVANTSSVIFNVPTWTTHGILALQWKQKLDMENKKDGGLVEFSMDEGLSWQSAFNNPHVYNFFGFPSPDFDTLVTGEYAFSGTDSLWQDVWLCYDMSWSSFFVDTIKVKFTFLSDATPETREGWMIDNVNVHITLFHPVKEAANSEMISVFPNPAKTRINIELHEFGDPNAIESMQLINSQGKVVKEWGRTPIRYWIDVSPFANGMYLLKVNSTLKSGTFPVLIQK